MVHLLLPRTHSDFRIDDVGVGPISRLRGSVGSSLIHRTQSWPERPLLFKITGRGIAKTTKSESTGQYLFPSLPVGTYQITVSVTGYTRYVQKGIVLSVGQATTQDVRLQVGMVEQQVVVTANSSLVTTDSATVGQLIDQKEITGLPLNGRDIQQLVFLAPGTTNVTANYCAANCEGGVFPSEQYAKVNGGGANGVNYLLDGVDANDTYINTNVPFPNPDAHPGIQSGHRQHERQSTETRSAV